ncbi:MAG: phage head morphogenesis protein [Desulfovibrio sp.]|jgi:SPP1 gp7 family putative phage head morphogenesis protein|nr:phage head morphogenesis protein [Desulfovibrio sp.]
MPDRPFDLPEPEIIAAPVRPEAAIAFWAWKAAMPYDEVKKLEGGARERAFYVTALAEHDAAQAVKDALKKALEEGTTLEDFKRDIADIINQQGWRGDRIETIFRNNIQTAYSAGRYAKMQAVKKSRPYWQYITVGDDRVRPSHAILNGLVFHADHEFWTENYPPNGHKCRCGVRTLSARQVEREGLEVQDKMPGDGMYTDPKTGMEYHVAKPGADDGWRNNPGKTWVEDIRELAVEKLDAAPALAPAMTRRFAQGDFENWSKDPQGDFPLVALTKEDAGLIGSASVVGRLSPETYAKQLKRHPELTARDYLAAQDAVERGEKIRQGGRKIAYALDEPGGMVTIVKATADGEELYVTSVWRLSRDEAKRQRILEQLEKD